MDMDEKRQVLMEAYVGFFNAMNICYKHYDTEMRHIRMRFFNRLESKIENNIRIHQLNLMNTIEMLYLNEFPSDERPRKKRCLRKRSSDWWDDVKNTLDDAIWLEYFSVDRDTFDYLCRLLDDALKSKPNDLRQSPPVDTKIAAALYKLTTNESFFDIGQKFGIHALGVQKAMVQFCEVCAKLLQKQFIKMPKDEEVSEILQQFADECGIPQVIGVLEGSFISISSQAVGFTRHVVENGSRDLILQVVIDAKCRFRNIALLEKPADFHEYYSRISLLMPKTPAKQVEEIPEPVPLLLTSRRPEAMGSCILRPFTKADLAAEKLFNQFLSKNSKLGALAFKKLKGRWKILQEPLKVSVSFIPKLIVTCCVLHNILETKGLEYKEEFNEIFLYDQPVGENVELTLSEEGDVMRDHLKNYLSRKFKK